MVQLFSIGGLCQLPSSACSRALMGASTRSAQWRDANSECLLWADIEHRRANENLSGLSVFAVF